jgi:hypothetical protein
LGSNTNIVHTVKRKIRLGLGCLCPDPVNTIYILTTIKE